MAPIRNVADHFIRLADSDSGDVMTHLRLQKLVYYAQAWSIAIRGELMVANEFQAWPHGPVSPALWAKFKQFGWQPIPESAATSDPEEISKDDQAFLDEVWRAYGKYSAKTLEDMTHGEAPWIDARAGLPEAAKCETIITNAAMKEFYGKQAGQ